MRDTLLDTAVDHFGRFGFDGSATRAIAKASGTAMSSITYHFGGKQGLYVAAAEHIAEQIKALHAPRLEMLRDASISTPEQARMALVALLDGFGAMMLDEASEQWARFIAREQQEPTEAFERLYAIAMRPIVETFLRLVKLARPDLAEDEQRATGFLLFGQALAMRAARASLTRVIGRSLDESAKALLRTRLREHALSILAAPSEPSP